MTRHRKAATKSRVNEEASSITLYGHGLGQHLHCRTPRPGTFCVPCVYHRDVCDDAFCVPSCAVFETTIASRLSRGARFLPLGPNPRLENVCGAWTPLGASLWQVQHPRLRPSPWSSEVGGSEREIVRKQPGQSGL